MRNVYDSIGGHELRLRLPGMPVSLPGVHGTNTVVSRENLHNLVFVDHTAEHEAQEETGDGRREPLRPEDFID